MATRGDATLAPSAGAGGGAVTSRAKPAQITAAASDEKESDALMHPSSPSSSSSSAASSDWGSDSDDDDAESGAESAAGAAGRTALGRALSRPSQPQRQWRRQRSHASRASHASHASQSSTRSLAAASSPSPTAEELSQAQAHDGREEQAAVKESMSRSSSAATELLHADSDDETRPHAHRIGSVRLALRNIDSQAQSTQPSPSLAASSSARGRLSESEADAYVRRAFPMLQPNADPYASLSGAARREARSSPHILNLGPSGVRRRGTIGAAATARVSEGQGASVDPSAALPLYLSRDSDGVGFGGLGFDAPSPSSVPGLTLPALSARARVAPGAATAALAELGLPIPPDALLPSTARNSARARKAAAMERAKLAMQVAAQEAERRGGSGGSTTGFAAHTSTSASRSLRATLGAAAAASLNMHSSGSQTDRGPRAASRSPSRRARSRGGSETARSARSRRPGSNSDGEREEKGADMAEEHEEKTFLTACSPFYLPSVLERAAAPKPVPQARPTAGGVALDARGSWVPPSAPTARGGGGGESKAGKEERYARLVATQAAFSQWSGTLARHVDELFDAKCADSNLGSPTLRRKTQWTTSVLRELRRGRVDLGENGLGERSVQVICTLLSTRLVPEHVHVLHHTSTPAWIQQLKLPGNKIGDEGASMLAAALQAAPALTNLDVGGNALSGVGMERICRALTHSRTLRTLDLSSPPGSSRSANYIRAGTGAASALRALLEKSDTLQMLNLSNCGLGLVSGAMHELCEGIAHSRSLTSLSLCSNALGESDATSLCSALSRASSHSTLTSLALSRNSLGSLGLQRLAVHLRAHHTLQRMDLSRNDAGLAGWLLLSHALQHNPALDRLVLDGNEFGTKAATMFYTERKHRLPEDLFHSLHLLHCFALFYFQLITFLSQELRSAHLRDSYVSPRLGANPSLRTLSLSHCGLRDEFVRRLCDSLSKHPALTALMLSHNGIRQEGAEGLASFLSRSPPLRLLDVSSNGINDSGGLAIARALQNNTRLTELRAQNNDMGDAAAEQLIAILSNNPTLTACNVDGCKIPYRLYRALVDTGCKNARVWESSSLARLQAEVRELSRVEVELRRVQTAMEESAALEARLESTLASLEAQGDSFFDSERARTLQLRAEAEAAQEAHRASISAQFQSDMELKRRRGELDATLDTKRKERDAAREARLQTERALQRARDALAASVRDAAIGFDESDRLHIVMQSHEKRNKATAALIHEDLARLADWTRALEVKVQRGEGNPHAPPGSEAAMGSPSHGAGAVTPAFARRKSVQQGLGSSSAGAGGRGALSRKTSINAAAAGPLVPLVPSTPLPSLAERPDASEQGASSSSKPSGFSAASAAALSRRTSRTVSGAATLLRPQPPTPSSTAAGDQVISGGALAAAGGTVLWPTPRPPTDSVAPSTGAARASGGSKPAAAVPTAATNKSARGKKKQQTPSAEAPAAAAPVYSGYKPHATGDSVQSISPASQSGSAPPSK